MRLGKGISLAAGAAVIAAAPVAAEDAYLRVVDIGAGLCVVAIVPGGHAMLYDAGRGQPLCRNAVRELVPSNRIDLVVLSHSDSDHVRELPAILLDNAASVIIHPGDPRGPTIKPVRDAIKAERQSGATVYNLAEATIQFGQQFDVGPAKATFIAGWSDGNDTRASDEPSIAPDSSMRNNALSIVIKFEYGGHSVLLTGDTVGRPQSPNDSLCRYSERIMVANDQTLPLASEVLIGQHHGADNATSNCFIRAVRPKYVIFSAGHDHRHPRQSAVNRLVSWGVLPENILRTDKGDHEGGTGRTKEWVTGGLLGCKDKPGDDDIEILLPNDPDASITVRYRNLTTGC